MFDYAVVNTGPISESLRARYAAEGPEPTIADISRIEAIGIRCVTEDSDKGDVRRHGPNQLAEVLLLMPLVREAVQRTTGASSD